MTPWTSHPEHPTRADRLFVAAVLLVLILAAGLDGWVA